MTGQSRAATSRIESESFVNGPAGGPEPPRLDVSGTDRSPPFARYSDSEEEDDDDDDDDENRNSPGSVQESTGSAESQIIRCYRCEAVSDFVTGNPLQVNYRFRIHFAVDIA